MVRRTLEVGNRGVQKAFNQKNSPTKKMVASNVGFVENHVNHPPSGLQFNNEYNFRDTPSTGVALGLDVQEDRNNRAKLMQVYKKLGFYLYKVYLFGIANTCHGA